MLYKPTIFLRKLCFCLYSAYFKIYLHILVDVSAYVWVYLTKTFCIKLLILFRYVTDSITKRSWLSKESKLHSLKRIEF